MEGQTSTAAPAGFPVANDPSSPLAGSAPLNSPISPSEPHHQLLQPCSSNSSGYFSTSPRQLPSDDLLSSAILEEEGPESCSDETAEPATPASARHSNDLTPTAAIYPSSVDSSSNHIPQFDYSRRSSQPASYIPTPQPPKSTESTAAVAPSSKENGAWVPASNTAPGAQNQTQPERSGSVASSQQETTAPAPPPQPSRTNSTLSLTRKMSSLFRRSSSHAPPLPIQPLTSAGANGTANPPAPSQPDMAASAPTSSYVPEMGVPRRTTGSSAASVTRAPARHTRRFSMNRSSNTTRSNTPPSPGSPTMEKTLTNNGPTSQPQNGKAVNGEGELDPKKKTRSSTGLSLRGRTINFLSTNNGARNGQPRAPRRANSFDSQSGAKAPRSKSIHEEHDAIPPQRLPWAMPPAAGTGAKARRMSLNLPDDFTVDVTELSEEFEYQHKFLGRHGKHLGKGAASKVTLMARKGFPDELYAVKEFRGKSHRESKEDYEKKIKSEYSIAKSLHHPNIVETVRLCTDHSRWNHVMEYCSEGDLFGLVSKGYLQDDTRKKDRMCLFKQLVQGVHYLHQNGIAHRDIKLENLLITKDSKLKITDFGVSEVFCGIHPGLRESGGQCGVNMGEVRTCSPGICGSEPYIAPEVLSKEGDYDPRPLDVWSTAIVMIYLTFGGAIWTRAEKGNQHYDALVRGWDKWYAAHPSPDAAITDTDYPKHKAFDFMVSPPALRRLLLQMLNPDPTRRISINDVVNNRWFKNIECCQVESYDDPALLIDATKPDTSRNGHRKIFCHTHLPPKSQGHSLGKMPGQPGY